MSLFSFGKKKKVQENTVSCSCTANVENLNNSVSQVNGVINSIKVLGSGCATCHGQYETVKKVVEDHNINVNVEYITDMKVIMEYGIMSMPAIVINDKVVSAGKVLKKTDIEKLIKSTK